MDGKDRQIKYIDLLDGVSQGQPFYVCKNFEQGKEFKPGKRHLLKRKGEGGTPKSSIAPPIDHRVVFSNELVLDLDLPSYRKNHAVWKVISDYLKDENIPFINFWSGGKGIHIHIFFDSKVDDWNEELKVTVEKAITDHDCNAYQVLRFALMHKIIEESGLNTEIAKKALDDKKVRFRDHLGFWSNIRVGGGHNKKIDEYDSLKYVGGFKTWFAEMPSKKPDDNSYSEVKYPDKITIYNLPVSLIQEAFRKFMVLDGKVRQPKKEIQMIEYDGKFTSLPCVQTVIDGVEVGKRWEGARHIAIACKLDKMTIDECKVLLDQYVEGCPQTPDTYTKIEAHGWADWIYGQPAVYWSCHQCKKMGLCDDVKSCPYNEAKYDKDIKIFEENEPLDIIKKALDKTIVGEDELKMQLFLIYLTKEFNPEWSVIIDGLASTGKTHVMKAVANLFGERDEAWFAYSRMTKAALNRGKETAKKWEKKIVIIEELQGARDVIEQLRMIISEGHSSLYETIQIVNPDGTEGHDSKETKIKYNTLFCTCNAEIFEEEGGQLTSRSFILGTNDSISQTSHIVDKYLEDFGGQHKTIENLPEIRLFLNFGLKTPTRFEFPFFSKLKKLIPISAIRSRRDIKKIIAIINSITYLRQKKRYWYKDDRGTCLVVQWEDVKTAFDIAGKTLVASAQGLSARNLELYQLIKDKSTAGVNFTVDDVMKWCDYKHQNQAHKLMSSLCNSGFFVNLAGFGEKARYNSSNLVPNVPIDVKDLDVDFENCKRDLLEHYKSVGIELCMGKPILIGSAATPPKTTLGFGAKGYTGEYTLAPNQGTQNGGLLEDPTNMVKGDTNETEGK